MSDTPIHDWLRPRLAELIRRAEWAGFDRDTVIAVLTDLITGPPFNQEQTGGTDPYGRKIRGKAPDQLTTRNAGRARAARPRYSDR